jgi:hypothetical protein
VERWVVGAGLRYRICLEDLSRPDERDFP